MFKFLKLEFFPQINPELWNLVLVLHHSKKHRLKILSALTVDTLVKLPCSAAFCRKKQALLRGYRCPKVPVKQMMFGCPASPPHSLPCSSCLLEGGKPKDESLSDPRRHHLCSSRDRHPAADFCLLSPLFSIRLNSLHNSVWFHHWNYCLIPWRI